MPESPIWEDLARPDKPSKSPAAYARGMQLAEWNRKRRVRRRRAAINKSILARKGVSRSCPPGIRSREKMTLCMRPGEWYNASDVVRAAGLKKGFTGTFLGELFPKGYVERVRNTVRKHVTGWVTPPGFRGEPKWLYRLTRKGEFYRELCLMLR